MEEKWRIIEGLKGQEYCRWHYEASNLGHIRNAKTKKLLTPHMHNSNYLAFHYSFHDENHKRHFCVVMWHRIIARAWVDNPDNLPIIDHINHDIYDNRACNLRWCTHTENMRNMKPSPKKKKFNRNNPVYKIDKNYNVLAYYANVQECIDAEGTTLRQINRFCSGDRRPKHGGVTYTQDVYLHEQGLCAVESVPGFWEIVAEY